MTHSPAMARNLKVFRMAVGFEDAYVAAPSRKAALAAWGSAHDQFARGVAEEVTDPTLTKEPLAHPGEVIRKSRGDLAAQLRAKPAERKKPRAEAKPASKKAKPSPPPKRSKLDAAESALATAEQKHAASIAALEAEREAIDARLADLDARRDKDLAKLIRHRDEAKDAYRAALEKWSG